MKQRGFNKIEEMKGIKNIKRRRSGREKKLRQKWRKDTAEKGRIRALWGQGLKVGCKCEGRGEEGGSRELKVAIEIL